MIKYRQEELFKTKAYLNGKWVNSTGKKTFPVLSPSTGEEIAQCADIGPEQVADVIQDARKAFDSWKKTTAKERSQIMRRWYELQMAHQEELAQLMCMEQGRPITEARGEIAYGASFIEWFAEEAKRTYGETIPTIAADKRLLAVKQPIGVVAAITPWNFPNAMITRKAAAALAAGCTVIVKPAEDTPLSALALAVLAEEAGFPAGVFNVIPTSDYEGVGLELTTNPVVKKVSFTGSTEVGKLLLKQSASTVKKVSLELGGNAPVIVFDDAELEVAATAAVLSKFRNCGQTCICANRIFVHENVYDEFVKIFAEKTAQLKQGDSFDDTTDLGPLINNQAIQKVTELVKDAESRGSKAVYVGATMEGKEDRYYPPTVLRDVPLSARIYKEEIFGPVAPVFSFSNEEEVISLANDTQYGLAAYVFTRDLGRAWRVSEGLEYGMVGVNETAISSEVVPFGGVKESGLGREGSRHGIDEYLEIKYICMGSI